MIVKFQNTGQTANIEVSMAMPRPKGKPYRIAEDVIPGFYRNSDKQKQKPQKETAISEVESKVMNINDNRGFLREKK